MNSRLRIIRILENKRSLKKSTPVYLPFTNILHKPETINHLKQELKDSEASYSFLAY